MKKQLFAAILSTAMILGMAGCGNTASSQTGSVAGSSAAADSGVSYTIGISQSTALWITAERDSWQAWQRKAL